MPPLTERAAPTPDLPVVDLSDYLQIVRRHKGLIVTFVILGLALSAFFTLSQTTMYTSRSDVLVRPIGTDPFAQGEVNLDTEKALVTSEAVAQKAIPLMGTEISPEAFTNHVSVEVPGSAEVLRISYSDPVPTTAQKGAQAAAQAYLAFRQDQALRSALEASSAIEDQISDLEADLREVAAEVASSAGATQEAATAEQEALQTQLALLRGQLVQVGAVNIDPGEILAAADLPSEPSSPNVLMNLLLGALGGLLVGVMAAFIRDRLDKKIRSVADVEQLLKAPVIGQIPSGRSGRRWEIEVVAAPRSPNAEAYRSLRTTVRALAEEHGAKVVLITSAMAGEGKSTTAANLAVVLAQAERRVLLISADLRRPRLHQFFQLSNRVGLSSVLERGTPLGKAIQETGVPNLSVLLSGPISSRPAELLQSDAMRRLREAARENYDLVLLDSTPTVPVADATATSPWVDGVLFVVNARTGKQGPVTQARINLDQVGAFILGAVLNEFDPRDIGYDYYSSEAYRDAAHLAYENDGNGNGFEGRPPRGERRRSRHRVPRG